MKVTTIEDYLKLIFPYSVHVVSSGLSMRQVKKKFPTTHYIRTSHSIESVVLAWKEGYTVWYHVLIHNRV